MLLREQSGESREDGAGCNLSALSLGSSVSRTDTEKGVTLICYSATVDLSCVFGLGKKLFCDSSAEQD